MLVRMIEIAGHSFAPDKPCIVCHHVLEGEAVLVAALDPDGDLQLACGDEEHGPEDWSLVAAEDLDLEDLDIDALPKLEPGEIALREAEDEDWEVEPL